MKISRLYHISFFTLAIVALLLFSSCSSNRLLKDNEYLLTKNKVTFSGKNPGISTSELHSLAKPKTNNKFIGIARIKLFAYNLGSRGKESGKFRTWLRNKVGEQPAVYDSTAALDASTEMKIYLTKVGYFYSDVSFSTRYPRKKKAHVHYLVTPSIPYRLKSIQYSIEDSLLLSFIQKAKEERKINPGDIFNAFKLDNERERITNILRNNGYYYFSRDFVFFEIDSARQNREMDLKIKIKPAPGISEIRNAQGQPILHKQYFINRISIRPDYNPVSPGTMETDTMKFTLVNKKNNGKPIDYYFLHQGQLNIRPSTIAQSIFIKPGDPYRMVAVSRTRSRINELGLFGYTNIRFRELVMPDTALSGLLDCFIDLSQRKLHSFTVETEATNSGGRPGIGLNFTYQNSNIFRGSEIFRLKARGALEAQQIFGDGADYSSSIPFFNTIETGLEASIIFPRFLIPVKQEMFPKYFRPKTTTSLGVGYENRPEYSRWLTNFSFGYDWKESERKRHQLFPFDWSVVNVNLSQEFKETIEKEPNDRIKNQYTDNLIMALRYSFTYNTQDIRKIQNFFYFKGNLETAGNVLNLGSTVFSGKQDTTGNYILFGIPFAQYVKADLDLRFFNVISRNSSFAYRLFMGAGLPYGNAKVLPLEKGFYGGGANGMRGWPYRLLGPGSYSNPDDNFDRMGDVQLEANIEYRFPVYRFIKSALFTDIGNIWLLKDIGTYEGGDFRFDRFYKEFAMDVGIGVRLDFNFFILRVDFAIPLVDPSQPEGQRWIIDQWRFSDIIINFGIGYPF